MLIRTKLLWLALIPAPLLLGLATVTVTRTRDELAAAQRAAAALDVIDFAAAVSRRIERERDDAAAATSPWTRPQTATLPAPPELPPPERLAAATAAVREGAQSLIAQLQALDAQPRDEYRTLRTVVERYLAVSRAAHAIPDLAAASTGSATLAGDLRLLAVLARVQDGLALERIYVRHAIATGRLPPALRRGLAVAQGALETQMALLSNAFGDEGTRAAFAAALAAAAAAGRDHLLLEASGLSRRQDLLAALHQALGYGGLRFHYANFLLTGDAADRIAFEEKAAEAETLIQKLSDDANPAEQGDFQQLRATVDAYRASVARLAARRDRVSPAVLEERVRTQDAAALAALDRLAGFRTSLTADRWDQLSGGLLSTIDGLQGAVRERIRDRTVAELSERRRELWATLAATLLTLALTAAVAAPLYDRLTRGIRRLVAEFERLVRTGDVLPRQVVHGSDELSRINQAVVEIGQRLDALAQTAERMAAGHLVTPPAALSEDDRLGHAMATLCVNARAVVSQAEAISAGNYETSVKPRSEHDALAQALAHMAEALRRFRDETRDNQWLSDAQLSVLAAMGNADLDVLAQRALDAIGTQTTAPLGALYLQSEGLQALATRATASDLDFALRLAPREGLVGRALEESQTQCYTALPRGYLRVKSGLGDADVAAVTLTPLRARGEAVGVVELGWLAPPPPRVLALLDALAEPVGLALAVADSRARTEALLQETQLQAERLREQQDELRQTNEELEQQTQMLRQSEEELRAQSEALQNSNEELEEKSRLLQEQREQLQQTAEELRRATRYKSEFLANMSHELRTPLNSLLILSKSLMGNAEGNLTPEQVRSAQVIHEAGHDLLGLINDILDLSKVEAGRLDIHPQPLRIAALLDGLRQQFQPVADEKGLALVLESAGGAPDEIVSDRQRLEQILRNLLSNALKFTERGHVALRVAREDGGALLAFRVEDSGIGIAGDQLDLIFNAFQQGDGSTSRKFGGTGLGLAIARQLATLLGGSLQVASTVGRGSTFTLLIPERPQPVAAAHGEQAAPPCEGAGTDTPRAGVSDDRATLRKGERSILVIEDDSRFADIVCDAVRRRGYKCIVAADGTSGLQLARRFRPSGIILDLGLPDLDGRRVLDVLKRSPATRHIPVHVVSAEDASQEILQRGAIGFLHKPVERADLQQVIDRLEATLTRGPRTVLVVENDAESQAAIEALLKNENTRVEMATTAAEALAALARGPVDCIVLDLTLPDGDGIELLERLRSDGSEHPPVVVYTGRELGVAEHRRLSELAQSVVLKGATSSDRLLDEVLLFLHAVEEELPEAQKRAVERARGGADALAGRKLLLVDDDLRNLFALSRLLRSHGLDVIGADNGQMALEQLERNPDVAAVLMDVMMPVMDGLEATRRIRAQPQFHKLPVITITARAMAEDRRRCMEAGASDYISKPVDVDTLVAMLKIWIGSTA